MATLTALLPATLTETGAVSTGETILFAVVALVTVVCGVGLLTAKRAVSAAVNMIAIMIALAVLYVANEAPFLGITQIVVYTGAVMTLVLFVVMLVGVGGDEPVGSAGSPTTKWVIALFGLGLAVLVGSAVWRSRLPDAVGLEQGQAAAPSDLATELFGQHVVAMELTGLLLIVAATGALTLTHRQRVRAKVTQRTTVEAKMRAYTEHGTHPGQKPMSGVYASTNTAAAPAVSASGETVEESVPRVLRARGQGLELAEVSPEYAAAQRAGRVRSREDADVALSGMPSMPGAAAPVVAQPVAAAALTAAGEKDGAAPAEEKEEEK
ncbi:NADH-quinone oxidoreductase subunit J [Actinomyces faecalis]|uniref:NADH-quinone oxidoreductase subunit J n=1 Tax=Actinomyces faecalis TaxID=2722820 RepID=UPI0015570556|nr:NADH-quinone oxidoreductase subunit J [Actinomyces faecalis]